MLVSKENITTVIPQRMPFVFIDALLEAGEDHAKSQFTIPDDHVFVENGQLLNEGLVEVMAQTAAAGTGYRYQTAGQSVPVGFIGAVQKLEIFSTPTSGEILTTEVKEGTSFMNVTLVKAQIFNKENVLLAQAELKIFLQTNGQD